MSIDARMAAWPVPSVARTKDTWLADFARVQFARQIAASESTADPVDAYLYLGPPELLLAAPPSAFAFLDRDFVTELHRRAASMAGGNYRDDRIEPDKVRARETSALLCRGR
jgi:hypothetical protein